MSLLRTLFHSGNAGWQGIGAGTILRLAGMGLRFLGTLALTRALGVENYGVFVFLLVAVQLITLPLVNGLRRLLVRSVAEFAAQGNERGLARLTGQMHWRLVAAIALLGAVAIGILAAARPTIVSDAGPALALAALLPIGLAVLRLNEGLVRGFGRSVEAQFLVLVLRPGALLLLVAVTLVVFGPRGLAPAAALALALGAFAVAAIPTRLRATYLAPGPGATGADLDTGPWLRSAVPLVLVCGSQTLQESAGVLILGLLGDERAVGHFHAANRLSELVEVAYVAAILMLESRVSAMSALADTAGIARLVTAVTRAATIATVALAGIVVLLADPLLRLFGPGFEAAQPILVVLVLMTVLVPALGMADVVLAMTDRAGVVANVAIVSALLNLLLCFLLIPGLGAVGAALAMAIGLLPGKVWMAFAVRRSMGIDTSVLGLHRPA